MIRGRADSSPDGAEGAGAEPGELFYDGVIRLYLYDAPLLLLSLSSPVHPRSLQRSSCPVHPRLWPRSGILVLSAGGLVHFAQVLLRFGQVLVHFAYVLVRFAYVLVPNAPLSSEP